MKYLKTLTLISCLLCSCTKKTTEINPRGVILLIGDGMGVGQISLLNEFIKHSKITNLTNSLSRISKYGEIGISDTAPHEKLVVDSACSATQLALADYSLNELIGIDKDGEVQKSIAQKAKLKGLSAGVISDTRLTHATPAAFAAHAINRWLEDEIAQDMIKSDLDIMLSGGANRFYPKGFEGISSDLLIKSKRKDDIDLIKQAKEQNYHVLHSKNELENTNANKLLGLFTDDSFPDSIWFHQNKDNQDRKIPTLLEMTKKSLNILTKNSKGFFLMVEAGQIDWAAHQNDTSTMLHEMLTMNEVLNYLIDYAKENPDILLIVTADHETGSFGLGYNVHDIPKPRSIDKPKFIDRDYQVGLNYGPISNMDKLYLQKISLNRLVEDFLSLEKEKQTSVQLVKRVNAISEFKLNHEQAQKILTKVENKYYDKNAYGRNHKHWINRRDYQAYYANLKNNFTAMITESLSPQMSVVWGTGGHTSNPVHVYSMGPKNWTRKLRGSLTHPQLGRIMQEALDIY